MRRTRDASNIASGIKRQINAAIRALEGMDPGAIADAMRDADDGGYWGSQWDLDALGVIDAQEALGLLSQASGKISEILENLRDIERSAS